MREVQSYIEELKIKKSLVGGFDQEAVYASMQKMSSMYEAEILRLKQEKEESETAYKKAVAELDQLQKEVQLLKFQLREEQKNQSQYEMKFHTLTQAIDAVNASRDGVIEESKKTAQKIMAEANEKLEAIRRECNMQKQQKDILLSKISETRQQFNFTMKNLRSALTKMLSEVDALQKSGTEQMFNEIKSDSESENDKIQFGLDDETNQLIRLLAGSVVSHDR